MVSMKYDIGRAVEVSRANLEQACAGVASAQLRGLSEESCNIFVMEPSVFLGVL